MMFIASLMVLMLAHRHAVRITQFYFLLLLIVISTILLLIESRVVAEAELCNSIKAR